MGYSRKKFDNNKDKFKKNDHMSSKKKKKYDDDFDVNTVVKNYNKYE